MNQSSILPDLIAHLDGKNLGRFPVWMMRQAGRYLPAYQEIRKRYSFWERVKDPELAKQVSLLPLSVLKVDGVIFFSDILTMPYGLELGVEMKESVGPVLERPLTDRASFDVFERYQPETHTPYVGRALELIKKEIPQTTALLGFAGAPWTLGCYLIEGRSNRYFSQIKSWMYQDPKDLSLALEKVTDATIEYLLFQARSGVDAIQLFDTWLCEMPRSFFMNYYLSHLVKIFEKLNEKNIKTIYFAKGASHVLADFKALPCQVVSVDSLLEMTDVDKILEGRFSIQGNLDPVLLLKAPVEVVRKETRLLVQKARGLSKPAILNLGHGILPGTPLENAKAFVEEARALWL